MCLVNLNDNMHTVIKSKAPDSGAFDLLKA